MPLSTIPKAITATTRIDYVGSPKHIHITSGNVFDKAKVELWVWAGDLSGYSASPTFIIEKVLVSSVDTAIEIELSDYIKPLIQPRVDFGYSVDAFDECVYYQTQITLYNGTTIVDTNPIPEYVDTRLATLGYNWYWEGEATFDFKNGSFGFNNTVQNKYYYEHISYATISLNLSGATSSFEMIKRTSFMPPLNLIKCTDMPAIIVYLNKQGLFDSFNVTGNITITTKTNRETYKRGTRNPLGNDRSEFHTTRDYNVGSLDKYVINTGLLTQEMGELVEEILHSDIVYLIMFEESFHPSGGITVDSTDITSDNTIITVDVSAGTGTDTPFRQIPVNVTSSDFERKLRIKDKANIFYTLELTDSNAKRNQIRG